MPWSMSPDNGRVNRVERLMINLDTGLAMICSWDECDQRARTPYQVRIHEHVGRCNSAMAQYGRHTHYVFCCERHLLYWAHSSGYRARELAARNHGDIYGNLPPGLRNWL